MARNLGMSVCRAQQEISSREFAEWVAYERLNPGDPERQDLRFAMICCLLANAWRGKGQKLYEIKDFMLKFDSGPPLTPEAARQNATNQLLLWANLHNRKVEKDGQPR